MKPINMIISAFGPYKNEVQIDFTKIGDRGIFLITGDTGSGKTTIFDGISFALFGVVSGSNRTIQSIRSNFADGDTSTFVELEFMHKGKKYTIRRNPAYDRPKKRGDGFTRANADASLEYDDTVISGIASVDEKIEEILGINSKQFKQIAMLAQGEFLKILFAESKERTEIFRRIFDTDIYNLITKSLGENLKQSKGNLQMSKDFFVTNASNISWSDKEKKLEIESMKNLNQLDTKEILEKLEEEVKLNQENCSEIEQEINEFEKQIQTLDKIILEQEEKNKKIDSYKILLEEKKELEKKSEEISQLKINLDNTQKIMAKVAPKEEKVTTVKREIEVFKQEIERINKIIAAAQADEQEADKKIQHLGELKKSITEYDKEKMVNDELTKAMEKVKIIHHFIMNKNDLTKKYEESKNAYKRMNDEYLEKEDEFFREQAGIMAEKLEPNKPCPVCGSLEHPLIAKKSEYVLSKEELEQLKEKLEKALSNKDKIKNDVIELNSKIETLMAQLDVSQNENFEWELYQEEWIKKYKESQIKIGKILENINHIYKSMTQKNIDLNVFKYDEFEDEMREKINAIKDKILKNHTILEEKENQLMEKQKNLKMLEEEYQRAYKELGFDSEKQYKTSILPEKEIENKQKEIETYYASIQVNSMKIKELEEVVKNLEKVDLTEKQQLITKNKLELIQKRKKQMNFHTILDTNQKIYLKLKENQVTLQKAIKKYLTLEELYKTASGNIPGKKRIEFEQYVQATYFDMIIIEANKRLAKMTENRFYLMRRENSQNIAERIGLELDVMDYYNGKKRDVKSLSGGEAFKAALSLALGLSDVIQSYSGGVVVDTLFIDEGFGSLDSESREQAIHTLMQLSNNHKLIGIISHVSELKEVLEKKIIVSKTPDGSKVEIENC